MTRMVIIADTRQKSWLELFADDIECDLRRTLAARKAGEIGNSVRYYLVSCESGTARYMLLDTARRQGAKIVEVEEL